MTTSRADLDDLVTTPRPHLRWLRSAAQRQRARWQHIRITGQLGRPDDVVNARRTGARL